MLLGMGGGGARHGVLRLDGALKAASREASLSLRRTTRRTPQLFIHSKPFSLIVRAV